MVTVAAVVSALVAMMIYSFDPRVVATMVEEEEIAEAELDDTY